MKQSAYYTLATLLFAIITVSCHDDNQGGPETLNELTAHPGAYRVQVVFDAPQDALKGRVFYNKGEYKDFDIQSDVHPQTLIIDSLQEGEQIIRVITYDANGRYSDPKGVKTTIYGNSYSTSLEARQLLTLNTLSPTSVELNFETNKREDAIGIRVVYMKTTGTLDSIFVANDVSKITVKDIDLNKDYYFYTVFKPATDCIDEFCTFKVNAREVAMKRFEKEHWQIAGISSETNGHEGTRVIDNDINSFWLTSPNSMPHTMTVDMQSEKMFSGFKIVQVQNPGTIWFSKDYRFDISNDNETWETISEGALLATCYKQSIDFGKSVVARYCRLTILNSYASGVTAAQIAEFDLFNEENVSGENGLSVPELVNAKIPFKGDGSDLFAAVGAGRMQKVADWIHSPNAYISFDNTVGTLSPWAAPVWGVSGVSNGKIYQTLELLPGNYTLKVDMGSESGKNACEMYGVAAVGSNLPDIADIAGGALGSDKLSDYPNTPRNINFTVKTASKVSLGIVYNLNNVYGTTGIPWSYLNVNGFTLMAH